MTVRLFIVHSNSRQQTWVYLDVWDRELNVALLFMGIFAALTVNYSGYRHVAPYKSHRAEVVITASSTTWCAKPPTCEVHKTLRLRFQAAS